MMKEMFVVQGARGCEILSSFCASCPPALTNGDTVVYVPPARALLTMSTLARIMCEFFCRFGRPVGFLKICVEMMF